jgi:hypothetical protein
MATITDIIDGASLSVDRQGITTTRVFIVEGLTGSEHSRLQSALTADGIPSRGDAHPSSTSYRVDSLRVDPIDDSPSKARITVTYKPWLPRRFVPDDTQDCDVQIGASLQEVESVYDYSGDPIIVTHNEIDQRGKVTKSVVILTLQLTRRETSNPRAKAQTYTGKVNYGTWLNDPPHSWLCKSISGHSDDGGDSYMVTYEFQRQLPDWDVEVAWVDPATGEHPVDLVEDVGIKWVQIYESINFSGLNLGNF